MAVCNCSVFCCTLLYVNSSFAIILPVRENWLLYFDCVLAVRWMPVFYLSSKCGLVCDCGIPGHSHLFFIIISCAFHRVVHTQYDRGVY